jgi:preprotein translocase subunit YajC
VFLAVISFKMSKTQDKKKKNEQHRVASVRKEIQQKRKQ